MSAPAGTYKPVPGLPICFSPYAKADGMCRFAREPSCIRWEPIVTPSMVSTPGSSSKIVFPPCAPSSSRLRENNELIWNMLDYEMCGEQGSHVLTRRWMLRRENLCQTSFLNNVFFRVSTSYWTFLRALLGPYYRIETTHTCRENTKQATIAKYKKTFQRTS